MRLCAACSRLAALECRWCRRALCGDPRCAGEHQLDCLARLGAGETYVIILACAGVVASLASLLGVC